MTRRGGSRTVPPSPPGDLSKADADLWSRTVQTLEPLRRAKPRVPSAKSGHASHEPARTALSVRDAAVGKVARPAVAKPQATPPPLADFDQRKLRRIARGQVKIEARIDLHGLRQGDAHHRLRAFVLDAHARGLRSVRVITGKGGSADRADEPWTGRRSERGVIRRNVPVWLQEAELRAVVVSFTQAHARHGGEGALYVHLRRRRVPGGG
jgi:DNA-nicking Smr family endonuclease